MRTLFITLACLSALTARAQKDLIVFRDGTEKIVQIKQVNSDKTLFLEGKGKNATTQVVENTGIYMIKYERRGNVFFTEDGDRFTSKTSISFMPSNTVALYLKKGEEILAYDFVMEARIVKFKEDNKKKSAVRSLPKSDVFMIKYPDGTKDVLINYVSAEKTIEKEVEQDKNDAVQQPIKTEQIQTIEEKRSFPVSATITLKKGKKVVEAIIHSDNGIEIQYKRATNPSGPMYRQEKKDIMKIVYNN